MAEMQNTGNPIKSNDVRDLSDNLIVVDNFTNSDSSTVTNRLGEQIKTLKALIAECQTAIDNAINSGSVESLKLTNGDTSAILQMINGILSIDNINLIKMSDFLLNASKTGYITLPSGIKGKPLIIQWGQTAANGGRLWTYPVSFPNMLFITIGIIQTSSGLMLIKDLAKTPNERNGFWFTPYKGTGSSDIETGWAVEIHHLAIGY